MVLGSHNSWSYLPVRKWWMKPIAFMARCQRKTIQEQYELGVRCFDLRVRFDNDRYPVFCHGIVEYDADYDKVHEDLKWINGKTNCYVRVLHEVRNERQMTEIEKEDFYYVCYEMTRCYRNIKFWCGRNLCNWEMDYDFGFYPTCEEKYSSVCPPRIVDDWWPWLYARLHNGKIREQGTGKDILLIDYVDIK